MEKRKKNIVLYFAHDSNLSSQSPSIHIRIKGGWQAYGIYLALMEEMRQSRNYELEKDYETLSYELKVDKQILEDIVEKNPTAFYTTENNTFGAYYLQDKMKQLVIISERRSMGGKKGMENRWKNRGKKTIANKEENNLVITPDNSYNKQNKTKLNNIREEKEIKDEEEKKEKTDLFVPLNSDFEKEKTLKIILELTNEHNKKDFWLNIINKLGANKVYSIIYDIKLNPDFADIKNIGAYLNKIFTSLINKQDILI